MEDMIFNNNCNVTKEEQLQNYFGSFDSDKVDALVDKVEGRKQKSIARELLQEVPNLLNTDIYSLKILVELLTDIDYLNAKMKQCRENDNLQLFTKLLKSKLDAVAKVNTILESYGLTPKSRKSILVLDMEE